MTEPQQARPTTWAEVLDPERGTARRLTEIVETLLPITPASVSSAADDLGGVSNTFASLIVLGGPEQARELGSTLVALSPHGLRAIESYAQSSSPAYVLNVLSFLNAAECCNSASDLVPPALLQKWAERFFAKRKAMSDEIELRSALVALAAGDIVLGAKLSGGGKLAGRFAAGETFGFNAQGFVRYLAVAIAQKAAADDARPAWIDFVRAFPAKKAAGTLDFNDLFWGARVFYHAIEGQQPTAVGSAVHALVRAI